jgi:hypothetical protein
MTFCGHDAGTCLLACSEEPERDRSVVHAGLCARPRSLPAFTSWDQRHYDDGDSCRLPKNDDFHHIQSARTLADNIRDILA